MTCHPNFVEKLPSQEAADSRVVVDGKCVTRYASPSSFFLFLISSLILCSRAPGTAIEFALKLVELLYGREKAERVAAPMLVTNF
jgi:4-methyl-5(b-hydroxyethyl)-thiazole monophosphate biosynthesis